MTKIKILSILEKWNEVMSEIRCALVKNDFDDKFCNSFELALDEAFANISMYAYDDTGEVEIAYVINRDEANVEFRDYGKEFNPMLAHSLPKDNVPLKKRKAGGLGIFIMKKQTSEIIYKREDNSNLLTLIKRR